MIAPQFDQIIYPFLKGRAYVEQNGERFFINKAGQKITRDIPNTLSAKVNVLDDNVGKLSEYLRNHADVPQLQQSSLTVFYWQTPYDLTLLDNVPDDYTYAEEFAQYNRLREKMRLERVDDLDDLLRNQLHYPVLSVGFFSALPFNQGATNVCFFIIRENNQVYLTWTYSFLPQTYVELLTQSQPFDLDALSESEMALLDNLLAHIEMACNDWEIATEKNQGIFVRHEFDEQADVNRLIELLDDNIGLTKQAKTRLKKGYFELNDQPEKFRQKLEKWLAYDKDELADVDKAYLLHLLLTDSITHYADDWKFDTEALSAFIANQVGQAFEITLADYQQGLSHINHNLEQQCAYSILNINSFGDNYHLMLVRTSDKVEFVALSERLNLSIHDF